MRAQCVCVRVRVCVRVCRPTYVHANSGLCADACVYASACVWGFSWACVCVQYMDYMLVIHSQLRQISYRSQNIEKEVVEKIYIIIGGFCDSDNIVLIEVTDPKVHLYY